jgi:CheY-like chemotaxis protein
MCAGTSAFENLSALLMDMEMPVMNGYQATSIIRQVLKKNIPIIALTAHVSPGEKEKCLAYGMNGYVAKPVDPELLFESMYNLTCIKKIAAPRLSSPKNATKVVMPSQVCNMGYLVGATGGNKKMMNNIVTVFFEETTKELTFLNEAIKKTNYPAISEVSHKIKSAFSILGISVLEPVFKEMEQLSSTTSPIEKIEQLNRRVNIVFKKAREEMKAAY